MVVRRGEASTGTPAKLTAIKRLPPPPCATIFAYDTFFFLFWMELRCRLLLIEWVMVWTRLSPGLWWHRASCSCRIPAPYVIIFTVSIIIGKHFLGSASLCSWHALYLADVLQVNVVIMCGATWRAKMSWASAWTLFDWKNRTNSFNQYFSLRNHNRYCKFYEI